MQHPSSHQTRTAPIAARAMAAAALLSALGIIGSARAAEFSVLWGAGRGYHNATLAVQTAPLWTRDLTHSKLDVVLEASAGQVTASSGTGRQHLTHVGLTPFARWWFAPQTALEFGIGANLFSGTTLGAKHISTAYQFGDSIGLLHRFADTPWTLGARFTHYSNADIKRPNPGQDYLQVRLGYSFN
ncbi:MAG: acyloxyacyl hydrolase [Thiomonas sp. 20-64-5]|nr:MAG: acyloxyacyl hydrolase [Thiomonas sp. 20-64-5]